MSEKSLFKQAQDYYGEAPLIILGSGASSTFGISGMGALAQHLIHKTDVSDLKTQDLSGWKHFTELLENGTDLETALHEVTISTKLEERVIQSTWSLINNEDLKVFSGFLQTEITFPLGALLSHMFMTSINMINIITTNYDRLAEYACEQERIHHYSGFTHGFFRHQASPSEIQTRRKVNIWKVHGSLDWFKSTNGVIVGLLNSDEIPKNFEPLIVTPGVQKYQRTHLDPFRSIIQNADQAITTANSYLCIGYGFNDEHIQPKLMQKCIREKVPITIITRTLSNAAKSLILGKAERYLAIERGESDDQSVIYSSLEGDPVVVNQNLWSLEGYLTLIM